MIVLMWRLAIYSTILLISTKKISTVHKPLLSSQISFPWGTGYLIGVNGWGIGNWLTSRLANEKLQSQYSGTCTVQTLLCTRTIVYWFNLIRRLYLWAVDADNNSRKSDVNPSACVERRFKGIKEGDCKGYRSVYDKHTFYNLQLTMYGVDSVIQPSKNSAQVICIFNYRDIVSGQQIIYFTLSYVITLDLVTLTS